MAMKPGKHRTNEQRCHDLCWKVHDLAQSFVLRSYTMYEFVRSSVRDCVLCTLKAKKRTKTYKKQCFRVSKHTPLLTTHLTFAHSLWKKTHQRYIALRCWPCASSRCPDYLLTLTASLWHHLSHTRSANSPLWTLRIGCHYFLRTSENNGIYNKKDNPRLNICLWSYVNSFAQIESFCTFKVGLRY